jgi:hypothetical protein
LSVAADVVSMGGAANDRPRSYTSDALEEFVEDLEDLLDD